MPSLTIFEQALSVLLWLIVHDFLQTTKLNCQKCYVFSYANTLLFSHENKMQEVKFLASVNIFYRLGIERKKIRKLGAEREENLIRKKLFRT